MDAIALIITLFLTLSPVCEAVPATETDLSDHTYRIIEWACADGQHFQAWQRQCPDGTYTIPFYLIETTSSRGLYVNHFGEVMAAGINIEQVEAYAWGCPL